ncbi:MAG TPA: tetratricopeptide repeat protein [Thermoanaerobaculia bacterium]|jgi:tetratricopeptide (TPR) repeat protein|nr:tetratricopeptide repeat protein [Thermoanaerobaculia bacterium]
MRTPILKRAATFSLFLAVVLAACGSRYGRSDKPSSQLAFGVDMARRGLWSEALFRFHQAESLDPRNPRVLNNLGVAYEATGEYDKALGYYKQALQIDPNNRELRANYGRFVEFYQAFQGKEGKDKKTEGGQPAATGGGKTPTVGQAPGAATPPPGPGVPAPVAPPSAIPEPEDTPPDAMPTPPPG